MEHGVVEAVVARFEHDGLFAAPCVHAHAGRGFLPVGLSGPPVPPADLDTKRWDGHAPRLCGQDKTHADRTILAPTFHYVASLDAVLRNAGLDVNVESAPALHQNNVG
jgi:hypothetical protein